MLNIDEITGFFISISYSEELRKQIYYSFSLFEEFDIQFYEDKYIDLVTRENSIDVDTKRDTFILFLKQDLTAILTEHNINLDNDQDITLEELNELVHFLYIIQNLEDYSLVSYMVHSDNSSKKILISLMTRYTLLSEFRCMELIEEVKDTFIESLKLFIEDKEILPKEELDKKHIKYINTFFRFTENQPCLGNKLYKQGYSNLTLNELLNIIDFSIFDYIEKNIISNPTQIALDILSLLIITKDNYTIPLLKFKQNIGLFTSKLEYITKIESIMANILVDFNNFLEAELQKEKLHEH